MPQNVVFKSGRRDPKDRSVFDSRWQQIKDTIGDWLSLDPSDVVNPMSLPVAAATTIGKPVVKAASDMLPGFYSRVQQALAGLPGKQVKGPQLAKALQQAAPEEVAQRLGLALGQTPETFKLSALGPNDVFDTEMLRRAAEPTPPRLVVSETINRYTPPTESAMHNVSQDELDDISRRMGISRIKQEVLDEFVESTINPPAVDDLFAGMHSAAGPSKINQPRNFDWYDYNANDHPNPVTRAMREQELGFPVGYQRNKYYDLIPVDAGDDMAGYGRTQFVQPQPIHKVFDDQRNVLYNERVGLSDAKDRLSDWAKLGPTAQKAKVDLDHINAKLKNAGGDVDRVMELENELTGAENLYSEARQLTKSRDELKYGPTNYGAYWTPGAVGYTEHSVQVPLGGYKPNHAFPRNTLVWSRNSEFPDTPLGKVAHLDEVQSDLERTLRGEGDTPKRLSRLKQYGIPADQPTVETALANAREELATINDLINEYPAVNNPNGPAMYQVNDAIKELDQIAMRDGKTIREVLTSGHPIRQYEAFAQMSDEEIEGYHDLFSQYSQLGNKVYNLEAANEYLINSADSVDPTSLLDQIGDTPFIQGTRPYTLALERFLYDAAGRDVDAITMASGMANAARSNVGAVADELTFFPRQSWSTQGDLKIRLPDGQYTSETIRELDDLDHMVGKALAQQLLAQKGKPLALDVAQPIGAAGARKYYGWDSPGDYGNMITKLLRPHGLQGGMEALGVLPADSTFANANRKIPIFGRPDPNVPRPPGTSVMGIAWPKEVRDSVLKKGFAPLSLAGLASSPYIIQQAIKTKQKRREQ